MGRARPNREGSDGRADIPIVRHGEQFQLGQAEHSHDGTFSIKVTS